jgi:putative PIN family toxin of toxin-antitoxin system
VRNRRLEVVISWELAAEHRDVLGRPKLRDYEVSGEDVRDLLSLMAADLPSVDVEVELRDPDDVAVVAAAIAGAAEAIVTGDRDLLENADLRAWLRDRGIRVLTPAELVERI